MAHHRMARLTATIAPHARYDACIHGVLVVVALMRTRRLLPLAFGIRRTRAHHVLSPSGRPVASLPPLPPLVGVPPL